MFGAVLPVSTHSPGPREPPTLTLSPGIWRRQDREGVRAKGTAQGTLVALTRLPDPAPAGSLLMLGKGWHKPGFAASKMISEETGLGVVKWNDEVHEEFPRRPVAA